MSASAWSFDNDFARNVIIFGADIFSSSHVYNHKNNFLILSKGPTCDFMEALDHQKKSLVLILLKQTKIFTCVYIIMLI